jgi:hypothetical protein
MRRFCLSLLTAVITVAFVSPVLAQPQRPRQGGFGALGLSQLVGNKSVQEELKLSDEQKEKLTKAGEEFRAKIREAFQDMDREKIAKIQKEMTEAVTKVAKDTLKPEQMKRLHQIEVQVAGARAFAIERVQKELKLDDKQKEAIKECEENLTKARQELFKDIGRDDREKRQEATKKLTEKRKEAMEKLVSALNADQKKAWKEMTGEPFEIKFEQRRRPQQ